MSKAFASVEWNPSGTGTWTAGRETCQSAPGDSGLFHRAKRLRSFRHKKGDGTWRCRPPSRCTRPELDQKPTLTPIRTVRGGIALALPGVNRRKFSAVKPVTGAPHVLWLKMF